MSVLTHTIKYSLDLTCSDLGLCLSCILQTCLPVGLRRMAVSVGSRDGEGGATPALPSAGGPGGGAGEGGGGEKDSSSRATMRELSMTK